MNQTKNKAWLSYPLRRAKEGEEVVGWFGGHPRGVPNELWPRCEVCGNPMCHMAQVDSGPWLDLQGHARISLFICHATGGRCEDWDPYKGANKVMLHRHRDDNLYDGPPTVRVYRRMVLTTDPPVDELELMKRQNRGVPMSELLEQIKVDKLGGGAVWLQGDSTPMARSGTGPMRLVLQLTTGIVSFDITPGGMAYVFVDPSDESSSAAYMLWQSGG